MGASGARNMGVMVVTTKKVLRIMHTQLRNWRNCIAIFWSTISMSEVNLGKNYDHLFRIIHKWEMDTGLFDISNYMSKISPIFISCLLY